MNIPPRISIITPSYNQAQFLEETICSVLSQDYPRLEYIIMDGGSTDGSREIIQKYAEKLAYWVHEPDHGQVDALNRGFMRATGDIFAWLNSDDTYEPDTLQTVAQTFQQNAEAQLVYGEGWYINAQSARLRPCKFVRHAFNPHYICNKDPILQQAAFWRRALWEQIGPLDASYHWVFDWDWFVRASQHTSFHYIPHFLGNYRVHAKAKTRSTDIRRREEQARLTRIYGGWWHPNALTQTARIWAHQTQKTPLHPVARLLRHLAERAFYGMYTA